MVFIHKNVVALLYSLNLFYSVLLNHRLMRWVHMFRSLPL